MSRSPVDSTRFTATGVWVKPTPRATTLPFADPAPKNETPLQKVKRLREAANRAKMAQVTRWDYIYLYGRLAADAAHRLTVYGIVFASSCFGVVAVFSITDMLVYNRRKRAIFLEDQELEQARILNLARNAVAAGSASVAQTALVEGIAEEERLMDKKIAERTLPSRLLNWYHGGWNEEKALKEQRRLAVEDFVKKEAESTMQSGSVSQAVQAAQQARSSALQPAAGGPLDEQAAQASALAENAVKTTSKGWFGWTAGGSKKE